MAELILILMVLYVTMVYGPIAAFLVELFPTQIRYTSMSLPYHIGNGWFGGMLPLLATAIVASAGSIYQGLWYPIIVALMTVVIGAFFVRETKDTRIHEEVH
jgi:ATP/ADP translocase